MSILVYNHFHKHFPFNNESSWVKATYAGDPPGGFNTYIDVCAADKNILEYKKYYDRENVSKDNFLNAMGQLATEYWILKNPPATEYVGCGTYRRYLFLSKNIDADKIIMPISQDVCNKLTDDHQFQHAMNYFNHSDLITNRSIILSGSVEQQYLQSQPMHYWNLFKEALVNLFPVYSGKINWLTDNGTSIHFETNYIMRKDIFQQYADELFRILDYIWERCYEVYPQNRGGFSEPLPWRYPGFIGERFFPFFVYANSIRKTQVPLILLN
jgi:hypothetical protein